MEKVIKSKSIIGKKYFLYAHTRNDNNDIFYIGVGTLHRSGYYYRAMDEKKRNSIWKRIRNKTDHTIFIIDESEDKEVILKKEIEYIKLIGRRCLKNGSLANITDGGEGCSGVSRKVSDAMRYAVSKSNATRELKDSTRLKLRSALYARGMVGRVGSNNPISKPIYQICPETNNIIMEFVSSKEAADKFNVSQSSVNYAVNHNNRKSCGYFWRAKYV